MSSPVAELEAGLNAMLGLKPPGVSGSQIKNLTTLCVNNVQSESVLIQKIFTHFKKTPGTHKLGVLYVVDSVTRRWVEHAKQHGQPINSSATDGTYAAGVHRVTELIPVLMNDILLSAPAEQKVRYSYIYIRRSSRVVSSSRFGCRDPFTLLLDKGVLPPRKAVRINRLCVATVEKIKKLVDIWEKGQTFPPQTIESFKQKLNAPAFNGSTTPVGTPPPGPGLPGLPGFNGANNSKPATTEAPNAIMEALANIAPPQSVQAPQLSLPLTQGQSPAYPYSAAQPPVNPSVMPFAYPPQSTLPGQVPTVPVTASSQPNGFTGAPANPMAPPMAGLDPAFAQQVQLIKLLMDQGISHDKIPALLATMQGGLQSMPPAGGMAAAPSAQAPYGGVGAWPQAGIATGHVPVRLGVDGTTVTRLADVMIVLLAVLAMIRLLADIWMRTAEAEPRITDSGAPPRRGHSPQPPFDRDPNVKWVDFDQSIPSGSIKVLSRTLFVGGVTCSEAELRNLFSQQGQVQTCIVNKDKRHAFVKMVTRRDAVAAKEAMESSQYRTRWGVGFGPRDCSDYSTGVSVIPINKLTEADRKWMLSAEYGGSGGRAIESGMVVEEPDIEIGAGVSSKAISRRMQTDKGGRHGPKSSRGGDEEDTNLARWRRNKDRRDERPEDKTVGVKQDPDVPQFPYGLATGPNGMPVFPPGFTFPAPPVNPTTAVREENA
ncbi:uncharacterized protein PG998_009728 [Apiospora kogelbergensis]|uniref:uncharacterized protein n=1 Tax=Apiospora kogelbergensis TaxID=1337665 RepID=UPI00312F2A9A